MTETEYYCTNCGSILDDQDGFDPDLPAWKCTVCGQALYGDDIGNRFPGVVWFCDDCGAILNNQPGFTDEYDKWRCTECGYKNEIDYCEHEDGEAYEIKESKHSCSNCGAILEDQYGFEEDKEIWKCRNCDTVLYGPDYTEDEDDYDGTVYRCKECGEVLNVQDDFDEDHDKWCCAECGHENRLSEEGYECPNCGAILEDQYGFEEDKEIWKCRNCNTVLYGPDYTEDENDYDGTVYRCEECGEVLNVQDDFDEDHNKWCCTECGHENRLSEEGYECPNCGAILEDQYGFEEDKKIWKCRNCDTVLYGPDYTEDEDDYDGTVYRCEECGEVLNAQDDFDEYCDTWCCTECGYENSLSPESADEVNDEDEYICTGYDRGKKIISYDSEMLSKNAFLEKPNFNRRDDYSKGSINKPVKKSIFQKIVAFGSKMFGSSTSLKKIEVGLSTYECVGNDYRNVANMLHNKGFVNIKCFPVYDLNYGFLYMENHISDIKIGNIHDFLSNSQFNANVSITIKYHSAKMVNPPVNYRNVKRKQCRRIYEKFIKAGFGNIEMEPEYDLVLGLLRSNESIIKIKINDNEKFTTNDVFRVDAVVIIKYHTFKKNEP